MVQNNNGIEKNKLMLKFHWDERVVTITYTVKPVCNDHLYNKIYYLWFIQ